MTETSAAVAASTPALATHREFELLSALSVVDPSPPQIERIANWDCSAIDWPELLRLAEHHGTSPLAARYLIEHARDLPPQIDRTLRNTYEANLRRSLWFTAELARITSHFDKRQLPSLPFKGPVLAESLYGDVGLRNFSDLDFLISPADFARAKLALADLGYVPSQEIAPAVERLWLRVGYERSFNGAAGVNLVEMQWALLPHFYAVDLTTEDLLNRSVSAVVGGSPMRCLSPEDSLLVICVHAAKHLWSRLIWLIDVAQTLRTQAIDYSQAFSRAGSLGILRILGVSFWLAKNVLGARLPEPADDVIAADPQVPTLGREFAARLAGGVAYDFESTEYFRWILKLRERRFDRARYLWRLFCTPSTGDVATIPLPESMFPLYRIVRLGRLAGKIVRSGL